jgi:DNA-binding MarR family transcriptional regulator
MEGLMMLEFFIPSRSRRKILAYLLSNPDGEYHLRQLSRNTGDPAPIVKRELDRLEQIGFILSWTQGNQRRFKVNKNFFLLPELEALVEKARALSSVLRVEETFNLKEVLDQRKTWQKRSKEVLEDYGKNLKRRRPRHPVEARILGKIS